MEAVLASVEARLQAQPFLAGFSDATIIDKEFFAKLRDLPIDPSVFPATLRWRNHIASYTPSEQQKFSFSTVSSDLSQVLESIPAKSPPPVNMTLKIVEVASPMVAGGSDAETNLPQQLLNLLDNKSEFDSIKLAEQLGLSHQKVIGAIKSLLTTEGIIATSDTVIKNFDLSKEGIEIVTNGSHEFNVFEAVGETGIIQAELMKLPNAKVGLAKALSNKWIALDKNAGVVRIVRLVASVTDNVQADLKKIQAGEGASLNVNVLTQLKKRKLVTESITKGLIVTKGPNFTTTIEKPELDLTAEMVASGAWQTKTFKKYNFDALGIPPASGHLHPLLKVRTEFRQIFLEMGFTEMPTNRYVESSFWNFDALFQPQQHPARDAHDTFFCF